MPRKRRQQTGRNAGFRNTSAWQRARGAARDADRHVCVVCRAEGDITCEGLSVHHIEPLESAWNLRDDPDNLVTLCERHHKMAERGEISAQRLRDLITAFRGTG